MSTSDEHDRCANGAKQPSIDSPSQTLVDGLAKNFTRQVERALDTKLRDEPSSLAFVDHYLTLANDEDREAIVALLASGAGAWFGELVRREIGATWIGDGTDPRKLRLLLEPQLIHFSPVDLAYEIIFSRANSAVDSEREIDGSYHLRKTPLPPPPDSEDPISTSEEESSDPPRFSDHEWVTARLQEMPQLPVDQFATLTGRFETLELILTLIAQKHLGEGRTPVSYGLSDYVELLVSESVSVS